jgi:hypothetical protein
MLIVPWAIGWGVAGAASSGPLLLLAAALALFLAHGQLLGWSRWRTAGRPALPAFRRTRWLTLLLGALGLGMAGPLLLGESSLRLGAVGALAAAATAASVLLVRRRLDHALSGQLLAAVALPLAAPASYYVAGGRHDGTAVALYLLDAAFFAWAVFYVRLKIAGRASRAPRGSLRARASFAAGTLLVDTGLCVMALAAVRIGGLSPLVLLAFAPAALQTAAGVLTLDRPAALKRVGILLTAHSALFGAGVIWLA